MESRRSFIVSLAASCVIYAGHITPAFADKITTRDFEELRRGSKMSEVVAAVGQPADKVVHERFGTLIEWHYPGVPSATNGQLVRVVLGFDKTTERLETMWLR